MSVPVMEFSFKPKGVGIGNTPSSTIQHTLGREGGKFLNKGCGGNKLALITLSYAESRS